MQNIRLMLIGVAIGAASVFALQATAVDPMTGPLVMTAASKTSVQQVQTTKGLVTGVADGDTFYMLVDGKSVRMRLAQIDAPEHNQAFGRRAEQSLRDLIGGQDVTVTWSEIDRYGRPIVQVVKDGLDVNAEQVRRGFAWVYRQYSKDVGLIALEEDARQARRGLWADSEPVEPSIWRKAHK